MCALFQSLWKSKIASSAGLAAIVICVGVMPAPLCAQNAAASSAPQHTPSAADSDSDVAGRVTAALHIAPYVYDQHIHVSVKNGEVVLQGFVLSDWDLRNAIQIATQAAGGRKVIDNITLKEGGGRR